MERVISTLLEQLAQDREALRARGVMIDILGEAVQRLRGAGFAPVLELAGCEALVVLRLDTSAWALRQVGRPVAPVLDAAVAPAPVVKESLMVEGAAPAPVVARPKAAVFPALFWTPERDAHLLELRGRMAARDIAAKLGTTEGAVHNRFSKLRVRGVDLGVAKRQEYRHFATPSVRADGVVLRAWTDEDDAAIIAGYVDAGVPLLQLAAQLGRSHSALTKRITHLRGIGRIDGHRGTVPVKNKWPDDRLQRFRELWPVTPAGDIAAEFGVSKGAISGMAHRLGLGPSFKGKGASTPAKTAVAVKQKSEPVSVAAPVARVVVQKTAAVGKSEGAAQFVAKAGGNMTPAAARPALAVRAPAKMMPGITQGEKEAMIAAHVSRLPVHAQFDAELDLELCEAVFGGKGGLALFSTDMGIDQRQALARFDAIVAPFRQGGNRALPIEAAGLILPALRARVKAARGVAA